MFIGRHSRENGSGEQKSGTSAFLFFRLSVLAFILFTPIPAAPQDTDGTRLPIPPILESTRDGNGTRRFLLTADEAQREFAPGRPTDTLGYNGDYLGPTIRVRRGENISIRIENRMTASTTVHWHGADVPAEADGGPHQRIPSGGVRKVDFTVRQRAATLWYHPHLIGTTAEQVYEGLAGLLIVDDDESDALGLPSDYGTDDIPLILQERRFTADGRFDYRPSMPDVMHGYAGNALLTNGTLSPYAEVPKGPVRLRLLNGSNSSFLRLSFRGLGPTVQIATDGGLLAAPVSVERLILSPGERAEVIVDFSAFRGRSAALTAVTAGGREYEAVEFRPAGRARIAWKPPSVLVPDERIPESEADGTRRFVLRSGMGARMTINGRTMSMDRVDERIRLGDTEIWEVVNGDGRGMMGQLHNFHLHAVQFRILDVNGNPPPPTVDGWKDTVMLGPGDRVRLIARFDSYPGLYMYHCHLLEHEEGGMMGQFLIEESR